MVVDPSGAQVGSSPFTAVREGYVWRGSDVVDNIVNKRYAKLLSDVLVTFRRETDTEPTKAWPLYRACDLTPVEKKELMFCKKGYNNVVAWLGGKFERLDGFAFTVTWLKPTMMKDTKLLLGFDNEHDATAWHAALTSVVERLGPEVSALPEHEAVAWRTTAPEEDPALHQPKHHAPREDSVKELYEHVEGQMATEELDGFDAAGSPDTCEPAVFPAGSWSALKFSNGTSVFHEEDETGGAYMVSCVVRAPPKACLEALGSGSFLISGSDREVLKSDGDLEVFRLKIHPSGCASWFLASRELTIERTWREEEDGTFVVLFKTTEDFANDAGRHQGGWWSKPVKAHIPAAGFTISPLRDEFLSGPGPSPESLVTLVLKVDLGGACNAASLLKPLVDMFGFTQRWVEQLLMTVVVLRDSVEQSKFTVSLSASNPPRLGPKLPRSTTELLGWGNEHKKEEGETLLGLESAINTAPDDHFRPSDGVLSRTYWSNPGPSTFRVRGPGYLQDRKKIAAGEPKFELDWVYLVKLDQPTKDIARFLPAARSTNQNFTFVVQIMIPGPPHLALVIGWVRRQDVLHAGAKSDLGSPKESIADAANMEPFEVSLLRFVNGTNEGRDSQFKLIPFVVEGSWIIRQSVGHTPVIMGRKLKQYYSQGVGYFEVDIDVASSRAAQAVVQLVSGATRSLAVDLAVLMEGKTMEELPESLLGTVRLDHVDMTMAVPLDTMMEGDSDANAGEAGANTVDTQPHGR